MAGLPQQSGDAEPGEAEPHRRQGQPRHRHGALHAGQPFGYRDARSTEEPPRRRGTYPDGRVQHQALRNLPAANQRQGHEIPGIIILTQKQNGSTKIKSNQLRDIQ